MTAEKTQDEQNTHHEIIDKTGTIDKHTQTKVKDKKEAYNKSIADAKAAEAKRKAEEAAARTAADKNNKGTQTVKVSNFDMPFGSMVVFMVKWAIASIPAILILMVLFAIFGGLILGIFATLAAFY
jgi:uncharacterized membrane protein YgcG